MIGGLRWGLGESSRGCEDRKEFQSRPFRGEARQDESLVVAELGMQGFGAEMQCPAVEGVPWPSLGFSSLLWEVLSALGQAEPAGWGWGVVQPLFQDCPCSWSLGGHRPWRWVMDTPGAITVLPPTLPPGNSFVRHNTRQLTRVYPLGLRMNSANYSPQEMWNSGCQLGEWRGGRGVGVGGNSEQPPGNHERPWR